MCPYNLPPPPLPNLGHPLCQLQLYSIDQETTSRRVPAFWTFWRRINPTASQSTYPQQLLSTLGIMAAPNSFGDLNLSIVGLGVQYPPNCLKSDALDTLAQRFYPDTPS